MKGIMKRTEKIIFNKNDIPESIVEQFCKSHELSSLKRATLLNQLKNIKWEINENISSNVKSE